MTSTQVALVPPYGLVDELRQLLDIPSEQAASDVDLQRALDAGRATVDWFTGRTFGLGAAAVARIYAASSDGCTVAVVDLQSSAPTVAIDTDGDRTFTTTLVPEQFAVEPAGGPPFDTIRAWPVPDAAGTIDPVVFTPGQLVRVTGQWGYADERGRLPALVNQTALHLGARWYKRREAPLGTLESPQLDAFQKLPATDTDLLQALFPLCRPGSPGASLAAEQNVSVGGGAGEWVAV